MKQIKLPFLIFALLGMSNCQSIDVPDPGMIVTPDTVSLVGWISTSGEWMLFPSDKFGDYDPYIVENTKKCVSLVNDTGSDRQKWSDLNAKKVKVFGSVQQFDKLNDGETSRDNLLSKKYYKDEVVENFCLRDIVFIVDRIETRQ